MAQIWHSAKFVRSIQARCQICAHNLGKVPNLRAQIKQSAKFYCFQICTEFKFNRVSNLITAQVWQSAKFVRSIQERCQICAHKLVKVQIWHGAKFVRSIQARCQICAHNLGKVPNLRAQIKQSAKFYCFQICTEFKFNRVSNLITAQIQQSPNLCT